MQFLFGVCKWAFTDTITCIATQQRSQYVQSLLFPSMCMHKAELSNCFCPVRL